LAATMGSSLGQTGMNEAKRPDGNLGGSVRQLITLSGRATSSASIYSKCLCAMQHLCCGAQWKVALFRRRVLWPINRAPHDWMAEAQYPTSRILTYKCAERGYHGNKCNKKQESWDRKLTYRS
jgi:hypothetical protein